MILFISVIFLLELYMRMFSAGNGAERKKRTQKLCLSGRETDPVALRGAAEGPTHACASRTPRGVKVNPDGFFCDFYTRNKWKTVIASRAGGVAALLNLEPSYIPNVTSPQNIAHVIECVTFSYSKRDRATRKPTAVPTQQSH